MNLRAVLIVIFLAIYLVGISLLMLPYLTVLEHAPSIFLCITLGLTGFFLCIWLYQDNENIKILNEELTKLKALMGEGKCE